MSRQNIYDDERFFVHYEQMRQKQAGFNETLERPAVLELLPDVRGAAKVTGVDPSDRMLDLARQRTSDSRITYIRIFAEDFDVADASVDIVVSSLALHYLSGESFQTTVAAIARWLRPGGTVIVSMEHPLKTAAPDADGEHESTLRDYVDEGPRSTHWFIDDVVKHHRTLTTIHDAFTQAGLTIRRLLEPMPTVALARQRPDLAAHRHSPPILILLAQRGQEEASHD